MYSCIMALTFNFSGTLERDKQYTFTLTKTEAFINVISNIIFYTIEMTYIPTTIIFGTSIVVWYEFRYLKAQISDSIKSKEIYDLQKDIFGTFRIKFLNLCDVVSCI